MCLDVCPAWFIGACRRPTARVGDIEAGIMMMKYQFDQWRNPEHPENTIDLRHVTEKLSQIRPAPSLCKLVGPIFKSLIFDFDHAWSRAGSRMAPRDGTYVHVTHSSTKIGHWIHQQPLEALRSMAAVTWLARIRPCGAYHQPHIFQPSSCYCTRAIFLGTSWKRSYYAPSSRLE